MSIINHFFAAVSVVRKFSLAFCGQRNRGVRSEITVIAAAASKSGREGEREPRVPSVGIL